MALYIALSAFLIRSSGFLLSFGQVATPMLATAINAPFVIDFHKVHITASIGVATYSNDSKDPEDLIKKADKAMYKAQEQGSDNYRFQTVALN